jgi:predicted acetyltransferase
MELRERKIKEGWKIELVEGERPISWSSVVDRSLRVGKSVVCAGGIGGVGTLREFRRRGYSREVMERAVALMIREGYDISFLHGIQDFYHKYGYATCMAEHEFSLETRDAERVRGGARVRPVKKGDIPQIARIYNRDNAERTGSAVRDQRTWEGLRLGTWWSIRAGVRVVVDPQDRVKGYVAFDDVEHCCRAGEIGGNGEDVFAAILGFLARRAVKLRREQVWVNAPADHLFAVYCREFGMRLHSLYPRNEKPMGRIINLPSCMGKILPELENRWGRGEHGENLCIATDIGGVTLKWAGEKLVIEEKLKGKKVRLRQEHLMQLLMGYGRPEDLLARRRIVLPREKGELMARLFPLQEAQLWWADRF